MMINFLLIKLFLKVYYFDKTFLLENNFLISLWRKKNKSIDI